MSIFLTTLAITLAVLGALNNNILSLEIAFILQTINLIWAQRKAIKALGVN